MDRPSRAPIPSGDSQAPVCEAPCSAMLDKFLLGLSIPNSTHTSQPCFRILETTTTYKTKLLDTMDHLLNQQPNASSFPDDTSTPDDNNVVIKNETSKSAPDPLFVSASQTLPNLTSRLLQSVVSPNSSAASLGLHMLSSSAAAPPSHLTVPDSSPPRLPPISLLTAAAATLQQPVQCYHPPAVDPPYHLRPLLVTPLAYAAPAAPASTLPSLPQSSSDRPQLDDRMCRYRNKKCGYPRAIKRNGERHNLCEHHRAKANQNQRKLESKRRVKKRMVADRVGKEKKMVVSPEFKLALYGDTTFA